MEDVVQRHFSNGENVKQISFEEFRNRTNAIMQAQRIFIPHITKSVTIAFELYQKVLAEQERDRFLTTVTGGRAPMTWLDQYKRPKCPECNEDLRLSIINSPKGSSNIYGYNTCWVCIREDCFYEKYSTKTVNDWLEELERK